MGPCWPIAATLARDACRLAAWSTLRPCVCAALASIHRKAAQARRCGGRLISTRKVLGSAIHTRARDRRVDPSGRIKAFNRRPEQSVLSEIVRAAWAAEQRLAVEARFGGSPQSPGRGRSRFAVDGGIWALGFSPAYGGMASKYGEKERDQACGRLFAKISQAALICFKRCSRIPRSDGSRARSGCHV